MDARDNASANFNDLPENILGTIFAFLDLKQIPDFALVNTKSSKVIKDPVFWQLKLEELSPPVFSRLIKSSNKKIDWLAEFKKISHAMKLARLIDEENIEALEKENLTIVNLFERDSDNELLIKRAVKRKNQKILDYFFEKIVKKCYQNNDGNDIDLSKIEDRSKDLFMHWAARCNQVDVIKSLVAQKVDIEAKGWEGTVLITAAINGHDEIVSILLAAGANKEAVSLSGTALVAAASQGHIKVVRLLLAAGVNKEAVNFLTATALINAAGNGHTEVVEVLLAAGADIEAANSGSTALINAAENDHIEVVGILLAKKANLEAVDRYQRTALMNAARNGRVNMVKVLLAAEANKEAIDSSHETALMNAARNGHMAVVVVLLTAGVNLEALDMYKKTVLMKAVEKGKSEIVRVLLKAGANKEVTSSINGRTLLMGAVEAGNIDMARVLLDAKLDLEAVDNFGETAFAIAAEEGQIEMARFLLAAGANKEATDSSGRTALMKATVEGQIEMVKFLLEAGVDLEAVSSYGETAFTIAVNKGQVEVAQVLLAAGASTEVIQYGRTLLSKAAEEGQIDRVKMLLEMGADPLAVDKYGRTPLMLAKEKGHDAIIEELSNCIQKKLIAILSSAEINFNLREVDNEIVQKMVELANAGLDKFIKRDGNHLSFLVRMTNKGQGLARANLHKKLFEKYNNQLYPQLIMLMVLLSNPCTAQMRSDVTDEFKQYGNIPQLTIEQLRNIIVRMINLTNKHLNLQKDSVKKAILEIYVLIEKSDTEPNKMKAINRIIRALCKPVNNRMTSDDIEEKQSELLQEGRKKRR